MLRKPRRAMSQINVVPYIDVMLVLLVIFMVTAPMINPGQVDLPSVGQSLGQPEHPVQVTLRQDGSISVLDPSGVEGDATVQRSQLVSVVKAIIARSPEQPVVIAADRNVRYEEVLQLMDLLKQANVKRLGLLARARNG